MANGMGVMAQLGFAGIGGVGAIALDRAYPEYAWTPEFFNGKVTITPGMMASFGVLVAVGLIGARLPGREYIATLATGGAIVEVAKAGEQQILPLFESSPAQPGRVAGLPRGGQVMGLPQNAGGRSALPTQFEVMNGLLGFGRAAA